MSYAPKFPLSLCLIVKNQTENIRQIAKSLPWLTHPDDEVVVVDTGSTAAVMDSAYAVAHGISWNEEATVSLQAFDATNTRSLGMTRPLPLVFGAGGAHEVVVMTQFIIMANVHGVGISPKSPYSITGGL